jgi:hypothetical protein
MTDPITYGDPIEVRTANGDWVPAVARSEVQGTHEHGRKVHDFPVIYVALPGRAGPVPWPAEDVRPYPQTEGAS